MKKAVAVILTLVMLVVLCACGSDNQSGSTNELTEEKTASQPQSDSNEKGLDDILSLIDTEIEVAKEYVTKTIEEVINPEEEANNEEKEINSENASASAPALEKTTPELVDGLRPEFKEAMDAYEAFYDEYCEYMNLITKDPSDLSLFLKYSELLSKAEEVDESFEAWDEDEMNNAELKYYLEVSNRVMQKLVDIA